MVKHLFANAGDTGSIPELGRSLEERNGNPLQCSCLENPMDRGAWQTTVHEVTELDMTEHSPSARCFCRYCVEVKVYLGVS